MDDVSYGALALALSLVVGTYAWFAFQRRGLGPGLTGAGIALLPIAAYLTRTLRLLGDIGSAVGSWAVHLVFSPVVWVGVVVAGVAVVLIGAGRVVGSRGAPEKAVRGARRPKQRGDETFELPAAPTTRPARGTGGTGGASSVDDDLADIEALLKSRGIT